MKEQRLISMVEYVLQKQYPTTHEEGESEYILAENFYRHTPLYAKFLSRPLALGMFVPEDEKGNVLEKPNSNDDYYRDANGVAYNYFEDLKKYQEAEERVLFKGFRCELRDLNTDNTNHNYYNVYFSNGLVWASWNKSKTIEDLVPLKPILTASAIKQIEG